MSGTLFLVAGASAAGPVTAGQVISAADLAFLTFSPNAHQNGAAYADFTFRVQDDGGTANGGVDADPVANTMTINYTPVNDAPQGTDNTIAMLEDATYTFSASDFGYTDINDVPANNFTNVIIYSAGERRSWHYRVCLSRRDKSFRWVRPKSDLRALCR